MPRDGSGNYTLPAGNPVTTATTISSTVHNNTTSDIATALSASLAANGEKVPTANLPMGGYKLTGLAVGSAAADSARYSQVGLVPIGAVQTASASATIDFTATSYAAAFDGTYDHVILMLNDVIPATNGVYLALRVGYGAGPTYPAVTYTYGGRLSGPAGGADFGSDASLDNDATWIRLTRSTNGISNANFLSGTVEFSGAVNGSNSKLFRSRMAYIQSASVISAQAECSGAWVGATTALTAIRLLMSSGNITSGDFRLYGVKVF